MLRIRRFRLDRYILSEILGPLALGFLVYTFILLLRFLFDSAEMIIRRGLPVSIVGELLMLTLPNIVVLTLPMSLLFGILIAVGRLSSDSELIAMRSSGISLLTLYRPILFMSAVFAILNTFLMVYALPWGNHALQQLRLEITTQSISQQVQPRVFYEEWEGKVLYVFETPEGEERWKGVFLAESVPSGEDNEITIADWGEVRVEPDGERVVLRLYNAIRHKVNLNSPDRYEISRHRRLDLILEEQFTTEQKAKISVSKGIRELTLEELQDLKGDPTASPEQRNLAEVEIHKKFSIPAACLVFGLFALPLGINNRRGGKASGFALSIGVILLYYVLLSNGEEAARYGRIPGWVGMWAPNVLMAAGGLFLLDAAEQGQEPAPQPHRPLGPAGRLARPPLSEEAPAGAPAERAGRSGAPSGQAERRRKARPELVLLLPRPRLAFPNLLDRYVVRLFTMVFALVVLSGVSLFVIFDLSETIDEILKNKVPSALVLNYYKYQSLQMFYDIAPIVVLVTTLMTFSLLARTNEITACKALGMSLYRLALPALAASLLVTLFCGYLESSVLPASNAKVAQLKDRIRGSETVRTYRRADRQWLFGQGRYIYNYLHYDPQRPRSSGCRSSTSTRATASRAGSSRTPPSSSATCGSSRTAGRARSTAWRSPTTSASRTTRSSAIRRRRTTSSRRSGLRSRCGTASSRTTSRSCATAASRCPSSRWSSRTRSRSRWSRWSWRWSPCRSRSASAARGRSTAWASPWSWGSSSWGSSRSSRPWERPARCRRRWRSGARARCSPCSRSTCSWAWMKRPRSG